MTLLLNGFELAKQCRTELAERVKAMPRAPKLAVILVGNDPASAIYVRNKEKAAAEVGIESLVYRLDSVTQAELIALIEQLNADETVDGILVQMPLPAPLNGCEILQTITPAKDVDGFHPLNLGKLLIGEPAPVACTPKGCMKLIRLAKQDLTGLHAVVIGRSVIVGKPMAQLLLNANCTVTTAHSKTRDLPALCRTADIVVAAIGKPKTVKADWIKNGAIVIDVGINRLEDGKLCGDVDFDACFDKCAAITPVPKGVGPMTIAMLLENTVDAAERKNNG
ncbi:MAG TPA: bifunctional methylenetetrahydrofolate dehydrogenase/methenyltetrahydrofolate cyclohydrolase FolD [Alphaproteobacteria bacterium]|nr:bifunctional methylenetetrahydrofolate dehydrogenase/methenyltetrahydrofolate cyclohydrolase FolD [Alphaproteobacteria bacterium]